MVVQHNLTAMNANRYLGINNSKLGKSLEKLSSGYAINRAGDNAAGLAVSEKMRSQIAGMTQGVKNAQDGISMVQTFEGALTETHSILQRMKTLADQMANGSYDDPIDRTAAQQEFLQLNDEINQIADTDFNGVIVLNGGTMADGLKAVDGMFDYANKAGQVKAANDKALADAQKAAQAKIDAAQAEYDTAKIAYDDIEKRDLSNNGNATQWNTVDNKAYTKDVAGKLFGEDGMDLAGDGVDSIDVTFEAAVADDGTVSWSAVSAKYIDKKGDEQEYTGFAEFTAEAPSKGTNGGFLVTYTKSTNKLANIANAIADTKNVKEGDTITLTFTNTAANTYAPHNIGMDMNSVTKSSSSLDSLADPTIKLGATITDANMTQKTADMLKKLDNATISYTYNEKKIRDVKISDSDLKIEAQADGKAYDIYYTIPGEGEEEDTKVVLATFTPAAGSEELAASDGGFKSTGTVGTGKKTFNGTNDDATVGAANGKTYTYNGKDWLDDTGTTVTSVTLGNVGNNPKTFTFANDVENASKGDTITFDISVDNDTAADNKTLTVDATYTKQAATAATKGEISFGVALDAFNFDGETSGPTVKPGKNSDIDSSVTTQVDKAYYEARDALSAAKAAYPKTLADLGDDYKVSTSDAFNKSEAKMTYTDSITLQVGARTKDAVNFTFQYASTSIGDLKADLNCTASGLGTDKLNINSQEDANYAIDKIDQAINKVSLIRGTFGAIQNRLDHKIDNMNVSIENLTSAESQIRDTNMAEEMMNFTKQQILAQASQAMLAQANQLPQNVLSLLR